VLSQLPQYNWVASEVNSPQVAVRTCIEVFAPLNERYEVAG
jgi:hypothetical protein